ncbi:MAG: hypothetical protein A2V90_08605 [Gammaproteobacteria bacterium RBG_16_57_12]|nr:MAG: hypothetical protein A2V90_08605 [Gammaproteobacteria bacterium RBG_16_57_12]
MAAVRQSYGRVLTKRNLVQRFYEVFMHSSPEIERKFAKTDFTKQYELLERSLTMSILYPQGNIIAKQAIGKIRESHSRKNLNIEPRLYHLWLDSLIKVLAELDPEFNPQLDKHWRKMMSVTLDYIKEGY